ncbi:pepsin/retropepsin-like aspartic protease family protein [Telluria beijingensis]|uniref:pepsin/retropepsin-like aspartic protease family protein n=1 Tax=Telluria beijingensis TaxID=3068633 RepID=UPI0027954517|nr:pepsin/retropepsin-like aspartic protease family protein [Massilia sp. REN29]
MTSISTSLRSGLARSIAFAALMFSSAAMAQSLPASCDMGELSTIPLAFTNDLRPLMEATINGKPVSAVVNIGSAQTIILNKKTLERLDIKVRHVTSTQFQESRSLTTNFVPQNNITPSGMFIVREGLNVFVEQLSVGRTELKDSWFLVEDFMDDTFGARVGAGNLLQTDLEVSLDSGYLKYFKPDGCFREHLAYWDPEAVAVPINVDLYKRDPRPIFKVLINGKEVWALLSTATPHSYFPASAAARLNLAPTTAGATREEPLPGHGRDKPVWSVPVEQMSVGGLDVTDFKVRLMDLPHSGEILVLGTDFLHRHRVYIAMSQRLVYFSTIKNPIMKRGSVEVIPRPTE